MVYKLGLKLWSTNTDYYLKEAEKLYNEGVFSYVELYIVPNTTENIKKWQALKIPFMLHAPHFAHNVNLANKERFEYNKEIYKQVEMYRIALNAEFTVIHGGIDGNIYETIKQLKIIKPQKILIENKPYKAPLGDRNLCRGYNPEEINMILNEVGCGFCLDIGHAICSANSLKRNPYEFLNEFNKLNPSMYHISDGVIDSDIDMHLHVGEGNYDFSKIFEIINSSKYISIETKKNKQTDLFDFKKDVSLINRF